MAFQVIDKTKTIQELEEEIIKYWKENKIFEKSIAKRDSTNTYTFVDGPPFVTGSPHYGSLLPSIAKDVIPRYQTMKGKRVRRVWGWDCHGLPIEEKVNKIFNIKSSSQLEKKIGIEKYVQECRKYVQTATSDWRWYIERIGRWVDMDNAYYTMSTEFMESVIWAFKKIYEQDFIYKGKRVSLFSTDTSTPVSQFEVAMDPDNYREVEDLAIFVKFQLTPKSAKKLYDQEKNIYIVAWTTTPWTIPSNFALAVNKSFQYALVEYEDELLIIATERMCYTCNEDKTRIGKEQGKIVRILQEWSGEALEGLEYVPVYNHFLDKTTNNDFKIYLSNDVTIDDGTGVLHIAPAFGENDFNMGKKYGLSDYADIDDEGKMIVKPWEGIYLRDASPLIAEDLQKKGNLLRTEIYTHRLPFYRGTNPLIYMAQEAYFINIQKIKDKMLELNEKTQWTPQHIKNGRFKHTIATSPDWCISRNRYWATIMPIWQAKDGEEIVIGSIEELSQYTDQIIKKEENGKIKYYFKQQENKEQPINDNELIPMDLHRDICDKIILKKNGKEFYRIPQVLDCWMDSGSVPFAEYHYPFENKETFEKAMPADFIIEYVGQVRAWFNVLLRISTLIFQETAFTNVICTGVLAGTDGRKMSKSYGNYPDPRATIEKYGADALRLYFMSSPVMIGEDMNFNENDLADQVKSVLNILWNTYKYFLTYAQAANFTPTNDTSAQKQTILDQWIQARVKETTKEIAISLDNYNIPKATRAIRPFIDDLSTWYIRRSRNRFTTGDIRALQTLYEVLIKFAQASAPIIPFITETIYRGLTGEESVHLTDYPQIEELNVEEKIMLDNMAFTRQIASVGQAARLKAKIPLKQPLQTAQIITEIKKDIPVQYREILAQELNVKDIAFVDKVDQTFEYAEDRGIQVAIDTNITEELEIEGKLREMTRAIQEMRKQKGLKVEDEIILQWYSTNTKIAQICTKHAQELKQYIKAKEVKQEEKPELLTKLENEDIYIELRKI